VYLLFIIVKNVPELTLKNHRKLCKYELEFRKYQRADFSKCLQLFWLIIAQSFCSISPKGTFHLKNLKDYWSEFSAKMSPTPGVNDMITVSDRFLKSNVTINLTSF
jgi:hypothetical protein